MNRAAYEALIMRLDASSRRRPEQLLLRTIGMGVLGYLALLSAIGGGLGIAGVATWIFLRRSMDWEAGVSLAAGAGGLAWSWLALRCLWVRLETPAGIPLDEKEAPELFRLISATHQKSRAARFNEILISGSLNAAMLQTPRLGVFGWYRSTLVIGLPLLQTLAPDELQAVLAHEFAHSGQSDGKVSSWLYRTRLTWEQVAGKISGTTLCPVFTRFFLWFWPRINAPALVLSRANEFACDRFAAKVASPAALARGLRRLAIQNRRIQEGFWNPLFATAADLAEPPANVFERQAAFLAQPVEPARAAEWLAAEMQQLTQPQSTHPSLAERLDRLGESHSQDAPAPLETSAADSLIPLAVSRRLQAVLSERWLSAVRPEWWIKHQSARNGQAPSDEGERRDSKEIRQAWNRIAALARLDGLAKVQPDIIALLCRKPDHCGALYLRGCHLAKEGDPHAIGFLERAASDPTLAVRTFETLAEFHDQAGQKDELADVRRRAGLHERALRCALIERNHAGPGDSFLPHDLPECQISALDEILARQPGVLRAWLVEKHVRHFPAWRHYVMALEMRTPVKEDSAAFTRILDEWDIDGYVLVLRAAPDNRRLVKAMRHAFPAAAIYKRP